MATELGGFDPALFTPLQARYIGLMERILTRIGFGEKQAPAALPGDQREALDTLNEWLASQGLEVVRRTQVEQRLEGKDWPPEAESMLGLFRMHQFACAIGQVVADGVPGDILEAGVWRGGACILARAVLEALQDPARVVWVADSFEGLPPPDPIRYPADAGDDHSTFAELAVSLEQVQENFRRYDLLDERVRFLPGWFSETLADAPVEKLAVLRADGDMYGSTMDILGALYDKVSPGGYVIIDDYALPGCRKAVDDFRRDRGIDTPMETIDWTGRYWRIPAAS